MKYNKKILNYLLSFILIFCYFLNNVYANDWWNVYFTSPGKLSEIAATMNPEKALVKLIANTQNSFYGAFYDIKSNVIVNAFVKAHKRGVIVKLVIEKNNLKRKSVKKLIRSGIKIVTDNRSGLMHNKFAIIDRKMLWTGSYNLTRNGAHKNNNNAIVIRSSDVANIYFEEFKEMFELKIFGNKKEYGVFQNFKKRYYVRIQDTNISIYFSPEDNIEKIILKRIRKAKKTIHFMAFSFTSDEIGEEIIRAYKKGVKVYGLIEKIGSNSKYSEYTKLKIEGISVFLDKNSNRMHHKVIIIDKESVITGSYNYSKNANKHNDENIIILDNKVIAYEYLEQFFQLIK